jgi:long-chain acyl-CoA synthetase
MIRAVPTGINWRLAPEEMLAVLNDSGCSLLFVEAEFLAHLGEARSGLTHVRRIIVMEHDGVARPTEHEAYESWLSRQRPDDPDLPANWHDIAMQTYTSGTTGGPKGVTHSVAAIAASLDIAQLLEISDESIVLIATPVFHATATGAAAMALGAGGRCVIAREAQADTLLPLIERHGVTLIVLVPTIIKMIVEAPAFAEHDLSSLRTLVYAAAPISPELLARARRQLPHVHFIQIYGSTETLGATVLRPDEHEDHLASAGRPLPGVVIRLVDPLSGEPVAAGDTGEVLVHAPTNMSGYWNRPEETGRTITDDGFVRTGDLARFDGEFLVLHDRLNDMIITGGENVYPTEVENVLATHPLIEDVAVIGIPSDKWGETVLAFVVRRRDGGDELGEQDVIAYARANLAAYKCPTVVRFVDVLPRNASGKLLKSTLREPFWGPRRWRIG